jgi:hypothetical protein
MKAGSGNFVTRGILLLIFVINRIRSAWVNIVTNYFQYFSYHFDDINIKFICICVFWQRHFISIKAISLSILRH